MQERVFKRKVLDANILKEMHANNVCYSKYSKDRFIPFRFDKFGYVECKLFKTTQAEIPNIFSVWDECFSSARDYKTL